MNDNKPSPPTEAIALVYDQTGAPKVSAKGVGEVAEQIISIAKQHSVHLHSDASLANLLATIDIGEEIPRNLYICIAEIIAYVYWLNGQFPPGWMDSASHLDDASTK